MNQPISASAVLSQLQEQETEYKALALLWDSVLPADQRPDRQQFNVWLNRYGFDIARKGIIKCGEKFNQLHHRQNRRMDQDYMIRYASGVMVNTVREAEEV